jgi:hypothetical protein
MKALACDHNDRATGMRRNFIRALPIARAAC